MPTFKVEVSHINLPLLLLLCCVLLQQRTHKLLWFHTMPPSLYPSPLCRGGEGVKREGREARHDDHHPSAPVHRRLHPSILRISGITELTPPAWRSCSWIKSFIPIKYLVKHIRYVLKISFQLFLVDFGVDLGARPQGHSELWPKGLSPKMPKSNKNNGR